MNDLYVPMIDTSRWQFAPDKNPDWTKAAAAGVKVNMIRGGKGMPGGGTDHGVDTYLSHNFMLTIAAKLQWTLYWRVDNLGQESGITQAHRFVDTYESLGFQTPAPLVMDAESYLGPQLEVNALRHWYNEFRQTVENRGYQMAVYANASFWNGFVRLGWSDLDLIVAHWIRDAAGQPLVPPANANLWPGYAFATRMGPNLPANWSSWNAWQISSIGDGATLGSQVGPVDCNIMKKDTYERWFGKL